ncbi:MULTISPECIES: hypothetical protein [Alteribacter]|uniref:Thioredoxin domain-containing protein n=1 Tax=Alteribacter keqinensis TaxID=2483800 RepID=A0A3M7TX02_9BACI|nr:MULTISPECIES: hypothetical protein [Alteribacter]MBM7095981.1 hypothetical protein [Alteribacter salitolerans]RNA69799.1 hypothetical protein EBO34_07655 [Alteribacter keqinensis]
MTEKMFILTFSISVMFLSSSCQSEKTNADDSNLGMDNQVIAVLFSDESQIEQEVNYYDAVLDLQQDHTDKIDSVKVVDSDEEEYIQSYDIESFPTLIIISDHEVKVKIEGNLDSRQILNEFKTGLERIEVQDVSYLNRG